MTTRRTTTCAALVATLLAACGGGGDDPTPPPAASLTVTGTAATGNAIAGGTVDVRCATGSGATTTAADGTFTVAITGGAAPCVARVVSGAQTLHGVSTGSGSAVRVNVTPLTELVVSRLAGGSAATFFAGFGVTTAAAATPTAAQSAASGVVAQLRAGGVDFSTVADVLGGPLVAERSGTAGDAHDQLLDVLAAGLTAGGTTLADLSAAIVRASPALPVSARLPSASLPPDRLIQSPAADCASMRSGRYRLVRSLAGTQASTEVVTLDAPLLRYTDASGTVTLTANGDCAYSGPSGGQLAVSRAGVAIARASRGNGLFDAGIVVPEQNHHAVADLAGDWVTLAFERTATNGAVHATSGDLTLDASGRSTAVSVCDDTTACTPRAGAAATTITVTANAAGGFDLADATSGSAARLFAYRAGGGELMAVAVASDGTLAVWGRKVSVPLPAPGRTNTAANLFVGTDYGVAAAISPSQNTILSADTATRVVVREAVVNVTTGVTRPETVTYDAPRTGLLRRTPAVVTQSNGLTAQVAEFILVNPLGSDLSVFSLPATSQLGLSVVVRSVP